MNAKCPVKVPRYFFKVTESRVQRSQTTSEAVNDLHFKFNAIVLITNYIISIAMLVKTEYSYFYFKNSMHTKSDEKEWIDL